MRVVAALLCCIAALAQIPFPGPGRAPVAAVLNPAPRTDSFISDGTWTAPAGVTSVTVEAWGAGGGGTTATGGGGGGAYAAKVVAVTPSSMYSVTVGTSAANTNGGDSTFDTSVVVAKGGLSGTNGGTGGQASASTGDTKFNGGNGTLAGGSAGGGGGAGFAANGSNGSGGTPGQGGNYFGGRGGSGATNDAQFFGAGGGSSGAVQNQGTAGLVRVTYTVDVGAGYPVKETSAYTRQTADTTSHVINMPSGIEAGDTLIVGCSFDGNPTLTVPMDWDTLADTAEGTAVRGAVISKVAEGSDTLTITTSASEMSTCIAYRVTGASGAASATAAASGGSSANANAPMHTCSVLASNYWLTFLMTDLNIQSPGTIPISAAPSGWLDYEYLSPGAGTTSATIGVSDLYDTAEVADPGTWTNIAEQWVAITACVPGFDVDMSGVPKASEVGIVAQNGATLPIYGSVTPSAVYDASQDTTVFAWEGWNGSARKAYVSSYNHTAGTFTSIVDSGIPMLTDDDHGVPALVKDHEGYWHLFGGEHSSTNLRHASTNSPNDVTAWTVRTAISTGPIVRAYPKPNLVGSSLYVFAREGTGGGFDLTVTKSATLSSGVATWGSPVEIIDFDLAGPTVERVYAGNTFVVGTEIGFVATRSPQSDTERSNVYFFWYDTATGDVSNYDHSTTVDSADLPVGRTEADADFRILEYTGTDKGTDIPVWFRDGSGLAHIFYGRGPNTGPFDVLHIFDDGAGGWTVEDTGADVSSRADVIAPVLLGDGSIQLYYPSPWHVTWDTSGTTTDGEPMLKTRSAGGVWGSAAKLIRGEAFSIGRITPVLNGHANARVIMSELANGRADSFAIAAAALGGLRLFIHGAGGFLDRP